MELFESEQAKHDKAKIKRNYPKSVQTRLVRMIKEMLVTPYEGIGKPEILKYELSGRWSRRLTDKERVVYYVEDDSINIIRYLSHYDQK